MKIVALVPAACNILRALGLENQIVGHSHLPCDVRLENVPICTEHRCGIEQELEQGLSAAQVYHSLSAFPALLGELKYGFSFSSFAIVEWALCPDRLCPLKLRELQPELIISELQTGVIAAAEIQQAVEDVLQRKVGLVDFKLRSLETLWKQICTIADSAGQHAKGKQLVDVMSRQHLGLVKNMSLGRLRKRVICFEWAEPLQVVENWVRELITVSGGNHVTNFQDGALNWNQLVELDAEVMVFVLRGYRLEAASKMVIQQLNKNKEIVDGIRSLHYVAIVDGRSLIKAGVVELAQVLLEIFHPEAQSFGHVGIMWQPLDHYKA